MSSVIFTYICGAPETGPQAMLCLSDLLPARKGPLGARVGLGRLLTLPYLLGVPIELHVSDERDLPDPVHQQVVAVILAGTGSELHIGGRRIEQNANTFPAGADMAPLAWRSTSTLGTTSNTDDESGKSSAVRDLAYALLREVELTGTQAAAILNAIPLWRNQTSGVLGYTGASVNAAASRSGRNDQSPSGPDHVKLTKHERRNDPMWWIDGDLATRYDNWGDMIYHLVWPQTMYFFTPPTPEETGHLTTNQTTVLTALIGHHNDPANDYAARAERGIDTNESRRSTLAEACWFTRDVTTGAFLNPRPYPPAQLELAAEYISAPHRAGRPLRELALALNNTGFLTAKRTGKWNAGTVKTLRENAAPTRVGV